MQREPAHSAVMIPPEPGSPSGLDSGLLGDELWPGESQLKPRPTLARHRDPFSRAPHPLDRKTQRLSRPLLLPSLSRRRRHRPGARS